MSFGSLSMRDVYVPNTVCQKSWLRSLPNSTRLDFVLIPYDPYKASRKTY